MAVAHSELVGPGVRVGVEVDERHRATMTVLGAEQRERDGVVAAERDHHRHGGHEPPDHGGDAPLGLLVVGGRDRHVAGVHHLEQLEGRDVKGRVVRP